MGSLTDYGENKMMDCYLGGGTKPATVYLALSTTSIADAGTGATEPVGNGYARVAVTNNSTNFPDSASSLKSNGTAITFPAATGSWGTVTDFAIYDASSGGNMLYAGVLTTSKAVSSGDTLSFPIGDLDFTMA